jgi:AcrR family transcriptional regulator
MDRMQDRRVLRTRGMILDAFLDLLIEKGYESLTIQDIIDRANVGRSTFYLHFPDKEALLVSSIDQLRTFILEQGEMRRTQGGEPGVRFGFSLTLLQHAQGHRRIYKAVVGKKGDSPVMNQMKAMLGDLVREEIAALAPPPANVPEAVVFDFIVGTFMTVLVWWMEHNLPCSAVEADCTFHRLVLSGLEPTGTR